ATDSRSILAKDSGVRIGSSAAIDSQCLYAVRKLARVCSSIVAKASWIMPTPSCSMMCASSPAKIRRAVSSSFGIVALVDQHGQRRRIVLENTDGYRECLSVVADIGKDRVFHVHMGLARQQAGDDAHELRRLLNCAALQCGLAVNGPCGVQIVEELSRQQVARA